MPGSLPVDTAHVVPLLEPYLGGTLAPDEMERIGRHLSVCSTCRDASEAIEVYRIVRAAPAPTAGPELRQCVYARIASAHEGERAEGAESQSRLRDHEPGAISFGRPTGTHPGGGWLSGFAAVAVVALLVSVFWALPSLRGRGQRPGQPGVATPTMSAAPSVVHDAACAPSSTSVKLPAHAIISDIALTSATSGWAVGSLNDEGGVPTDGLIMRFSQCHWAPVSLDLAGIGLSAIAMDSATDGWAIGNHTDSNAPALLHYSGGSWKVAALPDDPVIQQSSFETLRMRAIGDGWITAFTPKTPDGQTSPMLLLHLSGESVTPVASPVAFMYDLAPVGPNDLWVVGQVASATGGDQPDTYRFAHYQDGQWSVTNQPAGAELTTLHATSPSDVWANGYIPNFQSPTASAPVVAHYDGTGWQVAPQSVPSGNPPATAIPLGAGVGWAYRLSHPRPSAAGPTSTFISAVWSEASGQWQALPWPYKDIHDVRVWAPVSDHEIWAIGSYMVWTSTSNGSGGYSGSGSEYAVLLHYANGVWTRYG